MQASIREAWKNTATSSEMEHLEKAMSLLKAYIVKNIQSRKTVELVKTGIKYNCTLKDMIVSFTSPSTLHRRSTREIF